MKLHQSQYQDILKLLDEFQIPHERLSLVKKKGRIKVQIKDVDSTFEFFKRKSVSLSEDGKEWQKSEHYELNVDGNPALLADWKEVITHLNKWLQSQI
jgi:hypothetical protein